MAQFTVAFFIANKTLTFGGSGAGNSVSNGTNTAGGTPGSRGQQAYGKWSASTPIGVVTVTNTVSNHRDISLVLYMDCSTVVDCSMDGLFPGTGAVDTHTVATTGLANAGTTQDYGGSYLGSIDVERYLLVTIDVDLSRGGGLPIAKFPTYYWFGAPSTSPPSDYPAATYCTIQDRPRVGGTATLTVTAAGVTSTVTRTIGAAAQLAGAPISYNVVLTANANAQALNHVADCTSTVSVTGYVNCGAGAVNLTAAFSQTNATSYITTINGALARCTAQSGVGLRGVVASDCGLSGVPTRAADIAAGIWQMETPNTTSQVGVISQSVTNITVPTTSGFSQTAVQEKWTAGGHLDNDATTYILTKNTFQPLFCFLSPPSLTASGRSPSQLRMPFRGFSPFKVATVQQAASITLNTPSSANFTAGANTTLSGTAPMLIAVAGGTGSFYRLWGAGAGPDVSGYAWLRLQFDPADAGSAIAVTLNKGILGPSSGWSFPGTIAGDGTFDIDTTAIWSAGAFSIADSKWPIVNTDQNGFGVLTLDRIDVTGLPAAHTYKLSSITMLRKSRSKILCLPSFAWGHNRYNTEFPPPAGGQEYTYRAAVGDTDGRQSVELGGARFLSGFGGVDQAYSYTLNELTAELATVPGYTVTPQANTVLGWTGGNPQSSIWDGTSPAFAAGSSPFLFNVATHLQNNGFGIPSWLSRYQRSGGAWISTWEYDTSAAVDIMAQMQFDTLESWPPGCGDVFNVGGGGGGNVQLACSAILDGEAHGLAFDISGTRSVGTNVTVKDHTTAANHGTATTDAIGRFLTGTPYSTDQVSNDISAALSPPVTVSGYVLPTRYRRRFALRALSGKGLSYDVSPAGRQVLAWGLGARIQIGFASTVLPITFSSLDTGIAGQNPCVQYDKGSSAPLVWLAYELATGGVYVRSSGDEGQTWSAPMTINPTGSHVAEVLTRHSTKHFFWYAAGAIKGVVWDSMGNVIVPVFTAIAAGVDDDSVVAGEFLSQQGEHRIGLAYRSGGTPTFVSAKDATTFA